MEHLKKALEMYDTKEHLEVSVHGFIELHDGNKITFQIQDKPIKEVGINGMQVTDMLIYIKCLYQSLNESFPCRENSLTITKIEEAIHWQEARTKERQFRGVEGVNKL